MRGKLHDTDFFLYKIENFLLCGDVSLDRAKNKPVEEYMYEDDTPLEFDGKEIKVKQIAKIKDISMQSEAVLMMRLHFMVHTFLNVYVWDPESKAEVFGYRINERNMSTKQSHMMTVDKLVCKLPLGQAFNQSQAASMKSTTLAQAIERSK